MRTLTLRQERFCELVAEGKTYSHAYEQAYCVDQPTARKLGSRLMTKADILSRVRELRRPLLEDSLLTLDEKRRRLADIIRVDVLALIRDDGELDLEAAKRLPPYVLQDCSVKETRHRDGGKTRIVRIKVADKLKALEMDNELAGHGKR